MINLTAEQMEVAMCEDPLVLVRAFAGTGKTTTLLSYIEYHEDESALCLAFNRSAAAAMAERARRMGIVNADFSTMHSYAYHRMRRSARLKGRVLPSIPHAQLAEAFKDNLAPKDDALAAASLLADIFTAWCRSDIARPRDFLDAFPDALRARAKAESLALGNAFDCFLRMCGWLVKRPDTFPWMTHDAYMKLCALQNQEDIGFDVIIVDEAQDSQRVLLGMISRMPCRKVLVGDPCQQIYAWNGCVDAFGAVCGPESLFSDEPTEIALTRSFRCPDGITSIARPWLRLLGAKNGFLPRGRDIPWSGHAAFIARTNAAVLWHLDALRKQGVPPSDICLMGASPANFEHVFDVAMLSQKRFRDVRSPGTARFGSLKEFADFAREMRDMASLAAVDLVNRRGADDILALRPYLRSAFAETPSEAKITLSTVHRAKGSEFDVVALGPDFFSASRAASRESAAAADREAGGDTPPRKYNIEEFRLLYVAMTRAKFELTAPEGVMDDPAERLGVVIGNGGTFVDSDGTGKIVDVTGDLAARLKP